MGMPEILDIFTASRKDGVFSPERIIDRWASEMPSRSAKLRCVPSVRPSHSLTADRVLGMSEVYSLLLNLSSTIVELFSLWLKSKLCCDLADDGE
jgi:hypothetical protein